MLVSIKELYRELEGRIFVFRHLKFAQCCRINSTSQELFIQMC